MLRGLFVAFVTLVWMNNSVFALAKKGDSLYTRIGGKKTVASVIDDFVGRCATDSRISGFFAATAANPQRLKAFKKKLEDQLCELTGGPCKYEGKSMKEAHKGMGIRPSDFDALLQNFKLSLDKYRVQPKDKNVIVAKLTAMRNDVIVNPERATASQPHPTTKSVTPSTSKHPKKKKK